MSNFSDILTQIMDRKCAVNNEVIRYTGIDRSTFFKIKNGSRNPSGLKMVERIADGLQLNEEDRQLLIESYEIDQMGPYRYYGLKALKKFFMTEKKHSGRKTVTITIPPFQEDEHVRVFRNSSEVMAVVYGMLYEKSVRIRIAENRMSGIFASIIPQAANASPETEFVHIFMLDDTETVGIDNRLYNVNCFCNAMKTLLQTDSYLPSYCYLPVSAVAESEQQTNFILSDRFLLTYSDGFRSAVMYEDPEMLELYQDIFEDRLGRSVPFVVSADEGGVFSASAESRIPDQDSRDIYVLCPNIFYFLSEDEENEWFSKYMQSGSFCKEKIRAGFQCFRDIRYQFGRQDTFWHVISDRNVVERFSETGRVSEFMGQYLTDVPRMERAARLRQWRIRSEYYNVRTVREKCIPETYDLFIAATRREAVIVFANEQDTGSRKFCVREPGITALICLYLEKLEKECSMEKEEYRDFIDGLIRKISG